MDISSLCVKSVLGNVGCSLGLQCSANQTHRPSSFLCRDLVTNLETALDESLNIKEVGEESLNGKDVGKESSLGVNVDRDVGRASKRGDISGVEKGNTCAGSGGHDGKCKLKCLNKCATFPCTNLVLPPDGSSDTEEEEPETALRWLFGEEHYNQGYSRSLSLPVCYRYDSLKYCFLYLLICYNSFISSILYFHALISHLMTGILI